MKFILAFFLFIFVFFPKNNFAQGDLPSLDSVDMLLTSMPVQIECTEGVNALYNYQFDKAKSQFLWLRQYYRRHPLPYFLLGLAEWWKIVPNIEKITSYDKKFLAYMDTAIAFGKEMYEKNPKNVEASFFLAAAYGFKGRLYGERKQWTKATFVGKKALEYMKLASDQNELSPELLFGDGLYNYFAIWVPENYPMLKPVLFFFKKGNKKLGIEQLETVIKNAFYTRTEAQYFLMRIYANDENEQVKAFQISKFLYQTYPNNPYFHRFYARMLYTQGYFTELEVVAREIVKRVDEKVFGYEEVSGRYASFYIAYIFQIRYKNNDQAKIFYKRCVDFSELEGDKEAGYYLHSMSALAKIAILEKDEATATLYYEKIKEFAPKKHATLEEAKTYFKELKKKQKQAKKDAKKEKGKSWIW
ncbi:MAG: tol-pal system protein YbgF [Bacteroidetes bacterium]|nr:MAG: tol-pal system protein YbgF [Bacteroidota bacterium]